MSLKGLRLDATREYRSKHDPDCDGPNATVFVLGALSSRIQSIIRDNSTEFVPNPEDPTQTIARVHGSASQLEAVRYGLRGWKNFLDEKGNEIPFKTNKRHVGGRDLEVASHECLDILPMEVVAELAAQILGDNELTEEQEKNSEGSPSQ